MAETQKNSLERRSFLHIAGGATAALVAAQVAEAQTTAAPANSETGANAGGDNPYTRGMADFVAGLRYERIPPEVVERIKLLMLDSLGCALFGVDLEWSRILLGTLTKLDQTPACGVWGTTTRLSAPNAALINGTLVQGFELDDIHRVGAIHVGSVVLPPLLALSEMKPEITGRDFLTAAVAGYETGPRVGICMGAEHLAQGWHSAATVGVFSAGAASAAALRLSPEQTVHALGIAGTQASGLMAAQYGSMVKRMHAGHAAQSGLYGGLLAADGFTGIRNVFESDYGGFCTTFSRSKDRFKLRELTSGLGTRYETMQVSLKFYSCVSTNHTTLDAIRAIRTRRPFAASDVDHIVVYSSQISVEHVGWKYVPEGVTSAQLNLPFCVATLLLAGDVFVDQFDEKQIADPARIAFCDKIKVLEDPKITAGGAKYRQTARVEVYLKDGTLLRETVDAPRGSEERFASKQDVVEKFDKLAIHAVSAAQAASIRDAVLNLEKLPSAAALGRLLMKDSARKV
jgi:2-methylcitrate dehydratase PrpD